MHIFVHISKSHMSKYQPGSASKSPEHRLKKQHTKLRHRVVCDTLYSCVILRREKEHYSCAEDFADVGKKIHWANCWDPEETSVRQGKHFKLLSHSCHFHCNTSTRARGSRRTSHTSDPTPTRSGWVNRPSASVSSGALQKLKGYCAPHLSGGNRRNVVYCQGSRVPLFQPMAGISEGLGGERNKNER